MTYMKGTGYVRRRYYDAEGRTGGMNLGPEKTTFLPGTIPPNLDFSGIVSFEGTTLTLYLDLHHQFHKLGQPVPPVGLFGQVPSS
jgi:hypothetical protein